MMGGAQIAIDGSGMAEAPDQNSVLFGIERVPSLKGLQLRGPPLSCKYIQKIGDSSEQYFP